MTIISGFPIVVSMDFFSEKPFVGFSMLAFAVLFLAFFPQIYGSIDEHTLLKNALLLRGGSIAEPNPEFACRSNIYTSAGFVSAQFIGKSIFLIPFTFFGLAGAMLSGLFIHLLNAAIFFLILRRLKIDARLSLLYLFFPVMLWEARTLYSELLVLTAFLAAFYFYIHSTKYSAHLSGFFFGLAILVRYDAAAGFIAFALPLAFNERKKLVELCIGFVPVAAAIFIFNSFAYGSPLSTGYGSGASIVGSLASISVPTLLAYVLILALLFPLMLPSPLWFQKRQFLLQFALVSAAYLVLTSRFTNFFAFPLTLESTLVARLRYLVPLIGLLLIPYAELLQSAIEKIRIDKKTIFGAALLVMVAGGAYASYAHHNFTQSRYETYQQIEQNIPSGALIVGSSDDCMYSMAEDLQRARYLNVMPQNDLGPEGKKISVLGRASPGTYFISLAYPQKESGRQATIDKERAQMADFISKNSAHLEKVFETQKPFGLGIYLWKG